MLSRSYNSEIKVKSIELMSSYQATEVEGAGPMHEAVGNPFPEDLEVEILSKLPSTVEYRVF